MARKPEAWAKLDAHAAACSGTKAQITRLLEEAKETIAELAPKEAAQQQSAPADG